ncbi:CRAL-TRIO domain-containing protein [Aspergillus lucknowensis]|uniref:CRAL-TRIO domain-containing protein n=1 Tax=Aspergillus lucknowensis TaxID=176173 RepID=A0ABR4LWH7_9EURO
MAYVGHIPPGWLGNLSPEQEEKLQQMWNIMLVLLDAASLGAPEQPIDGQSGTAEKASLTRTDTMVSASGKGAFTAQLSQILKETGMSANEIKSIREILVDTTADELRAGFLSTAKNDHADGLVLRFLRARKFDVAKSFNMMLRAMLWRMKQVQVEERVLMNTELRALYETRDKSNLEQAKEADGFLSQMRMGKCYLHGEDKQGRPIGIVRVKLHKPSAQSHESIKRFILHIIETTRLLLIPPVDTVTILFDMTGFTISNMEYAAVKFIIECFQDNYPESLGNMIIHNAPWVFSGMWKIIKGWMDPVIVSKVHFTYTPNDLGDYIEMDKLPKELGGNEDYNYEYKEPVPGENALMEDTATRDALQAERAKIGERLLQSTSQWTGASGEKKEEEIKALQAKRDEIIEELCANYWKMDPYTRGRNHLDRSNIIQAGGKIDYYPSETTPPVAEIKALEIEHVERTEVKVANA